MANKNYLDKSGLSYFWGKIKSALTGKQDALVSGTNIKTINNTSLLGSGNITLEDSPEINIGSTTPSGDEVLWIDPNNMPSGSGSYITNQYSVATDKGYSANYINNNVKGTVLYENSTGTGGNVTLSDNYTNYSYLVVLFETDDFESGGTITPTITGITFEYNYNSPSDKRIGSKKYTLADGNKINKVDNYYYIINTGEVATWDTIRIIKVIGYK
jgi:hypothetical protein